MIYIIILMIILFLEKVSFKKKDLIIMTILLLVSSLRYNVGFDYKIYFEIIKTNNLYQINRFEIMNKVVLKIAELFNNIQVFFIIYAFFILFFVYITIKKYSYNRVSSFFVWYTEPIFFLTSLSSIRQTLAVSICFFSLKYIFEEKYNKFFMILLIAFLFHKSAIVFIPIYYIYKIDKLKYDQKELLFLAIIIFLIKKYIIVYFAKILGYEAYLKLSYNYGNKIATVMLFYSIVCFLLIEKIDKKDERFLIFLAFLGSFLYFILKDIYGASRVARYYLSVLPLCIPIFEKKIKGIKKIRIIFFSILFILALIVSEKGVYLPYNTIFQIGVDNLKI